TCVPGPEDGFEWCVNQPAVDTEGTTFANSDDGRLYAIDRSGNLRDSIFLDVTLGAAYTPVAIGGDGRLYAQNSGHLIVVGKASGRATTASASRALPPDPRVAGTVRLQEP